MQSLIALGKYFFSIPMVVFGILHFMNAGQMAGMAPGGAVMVYITGAALILGGFAIILGKMDKLAAVLLALLLLLFMIPHFQNLSEDPNEMGNILKNIALAGGALMYANMAKDNAVIG